MLTDFAVTFPATEEQIQIIRQFCLNKKDCNYFISVRQLIEGNNVLSVSMFANQPVMYIGIYSKERDAIVNDVQIETEELKVALEAMSDKYAFAMTRKSPVANTKLVVTWLNYFNEHHNDVIIPID